MKNTIKIISTFIYLLLSSSLFAQVPQQFNYQGIARDAKGNPLNAQTLSIKLSILPAQDATTPEYEEIQTIKTNEFGLYTLHIGAGTPISGTMKDVTWETGNKYIRVAIDPKGGSDYVDAGTNQLLSVPYAIYADRAGLAKGTAGGSRAGTQNYLSKFNSTGSSSAEINSLVYDNGTNVGIGTTSPAAKFHIEGAANADMRITSKGTGATNYATMQLYNDAGTSFGFTKASGAGGLYSPGIPRPHMALFANRGSMLFNATGNIGFGTLIGAAQYTRLFIDSATGYVGINTTTPGSFLEVDGNKAVSTTSDGNINTDASTGTHLTMDNNEVQAKIGTSPNSTLFLNYWGGTINLNKNKTFFYENGDVDISDGAIYVDSSTHSVGFGTTTPSSNYAVTVQPATSNNGILVNDPVNGYGLYVTKSGANAAAFFTKTSASSTTGSLYATTTNTSVHAIEAEGGIDAHENSSGSNTKGAVNAYSYRGVGVIANTDSNQAGIFTADKGSSTTVALFDGVLRGEYTGTSNSDYVGVYGYSVPSTSNYGVGVRGQGGYMGVRGSASPSSSTAYAIYGSATGSGSTNYAIYGTASGATTNYAGYFNGQIYASSASSGIKAFTIDHPLDPSNKLLRHSSIESNDMMNIYNGNIVTDANGYATVTLPDYFEALNENFKYQLTVIGTFAQAIVKEKITNNQFVIQTNQPNIEVSWQVSGVRHDAMAKKYPVVMEEEKVGDMKGKYLEPSAYDLPASMGMHYDERAETQEANTEISVGKQARANAKALRDAAAAERAQHPVDAGQPIENKHAGQRELDRQNQEDQK